MGDRGEGKGGDGNDGRGRKIDGKGREGKGRNRRIGEYSIRYNSIICIMYNNIIV